MHSQPPVLHIIQASPPPTHTHTRTHTHHTCACLHKHLSRPLTRPLAQVTYTTSTRSLYMIHVLLCFRILMALVAIHRSGYGTRLLPSRRGRCFTLSKARSTSVRTWLHYCTRNWYVMFVDSSDKQRRLSNTQTNTHTHTHTHKQTHTHTHTHTHAHINKRTHRFRIRQVNRICGSCKFSCPPIVVSLRTHCARRALPCGISLWRFITFKFL